MSIKLAPHIHIRVGLASLHCVRDSTRAKARETEWQRKKEVVLDIITDLTKCQNMVNKERLQWKCEYAVVWKRGMT